jgi:Fibronectin type III domain
VPYMVLPDAPTMGPGCGAGTDAQNTEDYTSHELIETVTDPLVGLNTLSWYNDQQGEIGDICNAQEAALDTAYVVQKEWSNAANSCIVNKPTFTPGTPTAASAAAQPGRKVKLSWTAPAATGGSPLSEYVVYQTTVAGRQGVTVAHVPAGTTTWTSGALTDGTTYRFEIAARNDAGVSSKDTSQLSATADGTAPSVTVTSPSARFQLSKTIHVGYSATDSGSGVASYDVQQRSAAWNGGFGAWSSVASSTTTTAISVTGALGHEYCFEIRARDHAGNVSGWSAAHCTTLPLDDRALTAGSGWSRVKDSAAYRGTLTRTATKGSKLTLSGAQVARIALVVRTCSSCGKVGIYLGSTLWKTVDTHAASTHERVILLPGSFSLRTTSIKLKAMSAGKKVAIDGLGIAKG